MAFTGAGTLTPLGYNQIMITGVSLAAATAGTIGNTADLGADVKLPAGHAPLTVEDVVVVNQVVAGAVQPFTVAKSGSPVRATITNVDGGNASGGLEIWIRKSFSGTA